MNDKIVVFGGNGQVGSALGELLGNRAVVLKRDDADFTDPASLRTVLEKLQPTSVINAVAYTAVDKAEEEEQLATLINADAPQVIAEYCQEQNIPFVHYSTDYVFAGEGDLPRNTDAPTDPINAYGRSKLAGENNIKGIGGKHLIFRTSWVYDATGKNFLNTMLHLAANREDLSIISDQVGAPSYAPHIAEATIQTLDHAVSISDFPSGIYHLCGQGEASWYDFAQEIFSQAKALSVPLKIKNVKAIPTSEYPTPAKRPLNSRLDCSKTEEILGVAMPDWQKSLEVCMKQKAK